MHHNLHHVEHLGKVLLPEITADISSTGDALIMIRLDETNSVTIKDTQEKGQAPRHHLICHDQMQQLNFQMKCHYQRQLYIEHPNQQPMK